MSFPDEVDLLLMTFLRPCKFYSKSAFEKLQKYLKFRMKHKKLCENITVDSVSKVFEDDLLKYQPVRDQYGRRILYLHCGSECLKNFRKILFLSQSSPSEKWIPSRASTHDVFRAIQLSLTAAMAEPMTQVAISKPLRFACGK